MAELVAISSVWPSGAAFATAFTPTCWPAPGRFSTTNGLPMRCSQTCAAMRASRSVEPAGVNGTITVTVFDGQSCAEAGMIAANKTRKGHSSHRGVMGMPPVDLASGDKHAPVEPVAARRPAVAPAAAHELAAGIRFAETDRDGGLRDQPQSTLTRGLSHLVQLSAGYVLPMMRAPW